MTTKAKFLEPSAEMIHEVYDRINFVDHDDSGIREGLDVVLTVAEKRLRAHIAYRIRAELVCCDIYEQSATARDIDGPDVVVGEGPHAICYWGEAGARIAEAD